MESAALEHMIDARVMRMNRYPRAQAPAPTAAQLEQRVSLVVVKF